MISNPTDLYLIGSVAIAVFMLRRPHLMEQSALGERAANSLLRGRMDNMVIASQYGAPANAMTNEATKPEVYIDPATGQPDTDYVANIQ